MVTVISLNNSCEILFTKNGEIPSEIVGPAPYGGAGIFFAERWLLESEKQTCFGLRLGV